MLKGLCVEIRGGRKPAQNSVKKILLDERAQIVTGDHSGKCVIIDLRECEDCKKNYGKSGPRVIVENEFGIEVVAHLSKDYSKIELLEAIALVSRSTNKLSDEVSLSKEYPDHKDVKMLSWREKEVALSLIDGKSNKIIARDLGISEMTVKVHVRAILKKTRTENRTQIALWAKTHLTGNIV